MTIALSDHSPRESYTVAQGVTQTQFTVPFEFFDDADLNFYVDGTKKDLTTHYTVTGGNGANGTIDTTSGNSVVGISGGSTVVITRSIALNRTTDFPSSGAFDVAKLNTELDRFTAIADDITDTVSRSLQLADEDTAVSTTLPLKADRVGTVLGFNATTGAVEAGPTITAVQSLSAVTASINLLGTSAVVEDIGLLGTSAVIEDMGFLGTSANVTAMGHIGTSANVTAMGHLGTSANVTAMGHLGTSANVTNMATLGSSGVVANIATVAGKASLITSDFSSGMSLVTSDFVSDVNTLAVTDVINDINTLATSDIVSDLNTLATTDIVADLNTLATSDIVADLNTLATTDIVADINTLATNDVVSDLNELATSDFVADLNTMATTANINNLSTVATNITGVNSFSQRYRVASSEPSSDNDAGDLFFNTTTNELRAYNGSIFQATAPSASSQNNINIVAGEITSTEDLGSIADSIDTSSGNNIDTVANAITNINTVADANTNIANLNASGVITNIANLNASGVITNIGTVASNVAGVTSFAEKYRVASSAPTSSLDEGDLYYNSTANSLNYYNGSSWVAVVAGAMTSLLVDTTPQLGGNLDVNGNSIVSVSNGDITIAPNGSGEINLNGTVNTDNLTIDFGSIA